MYRAIPREMTKNISWGILELTSVNYVRSKSMETTNEQVPGERFSSLFERMGSKLLIALVFLLPLFVLPLSGVPFELGKTILIYTIAISAFGLFLLSVITKGEVTFPTSFSLYALAAIAILSLASSFSAAQFSRAFVGYGFEMDTVLFTFTMLAVMFLSSLLFRSRHAIFNVEAALFVSFIIVALFELIRLLFGSEVLSFGIFTTTVSTPVGSWNDLGILSGLITILSLIALELLPTRGVFFVLLHGVFFTSLLILAVVNFSTLWYVIGFFALSFVIYSLSFKQNLVKGPVENWRRAPLLPPMLLGLLIIFIFGSAPVSGFISNTFDINYITARPSWQSTFDIGGRTIKDKPFLGAGPNHFSDEWLLYRPLIINETPFWNVDFTLGIGTIPSSIVTLGLLGALAWIVFFGSIIFESFRAIDRLKNDTVGSYVILSTALSTLFLFLLSVLYTPGSAVYTLLFVFGGLLIGALVTEGVVGEKTFSFAAHPSRSFPSVLAAVILLIATFVSGYFLFERTIAFAYAGFGKTAYEKGDTDQALKYINRAVGLTSSDIHYRSLSELLLSKLSDIVSNKNNASADVLRSQFQTTLQQTVEAGKAAVEADRSNYQNWLALGSVYEAVVPLQIGGAYENAKAAYGRAGALNPSSPFIELRLASLERGNGNNAEAKKHIAEALKRKNNYTEAIFLLSQIEVSEGNLKGAINSVEAATVIAPGNPAVFFQLGLLRYNNKDYRGAASALEQAIALQSSYANARYFLGLSYDKLSRRAEAITQFEAIEKTNSDNEEIKLILGNLRAGRSPFSNAKPPVDTKPEQRKNLPVPERAKTSLL